MAKDVVLKLSINGVDTSIKNLGELETHLKQLKKDIKGVDLGSDAFNKMQAEIKQTDAKLKELNAGMKNNSGLMGKLPQMTANVIAGYAAMAAAMAGVINYGKQTIDVFLRQEDASDMVSDAFGDYAGVINDAADATQKLTKIGNEQYQELAVQAKNFGVANQDVNQTVKDAIALGDLYASAGANEAGMLEALIDAQNGKTKGLEKYVKELRGVTDEEERARILNEKIAQGWLQASTAGATFGDQIEMIKNAYGDAQEEIGGQLLTGLIGDPRDMAVAREGIEKFIETLNKTQIISKYLSMIREQAMMMIEPFENLFKLIGDGGDATDGITKAMDAFFFIINAIQTPVKLFWSLLNSLTGALLNIKNLFKNIEDANWQDVWNILNEAITDLLEPISELVGMEDEVAKFFGVQKDEIKLTDEEYEKLNALIFDTESIMRNAKFQVNMSDVQSDIGGVRTTLDDLNKELEDNEDAIEDAKKAYESYSKAIFAANEEYKLSIALTEDDNEIKKISLKLAQDTFNAYKTYYANGGYTQFEIDKLAELQKIINDLSFENFVAPLQVKLIAEGGADTMFKNVEEQIENWKPKDIKPEALPELGEDIGLSFGEAFASGLENGNLAETMTDFVANSIGVDSEGAKMLIEKGTETALQLYGNIKSIRNQQMQEEMAELDALYQKKLKAAEGNEKQTEFLEKAYAIRKAKLEEEQRKKRKKQAIADAIINGALAITNIWATTPKADFGVMTGVLTGLAAVQTAAQIAVIASQKFAKGGILNGPSHAQGGILTQFGELEGGEAVINKRNTATFAPLLSQINSFGGNGNSFAPQMQLIDYDLLASKINDKKVYVVDRDITNRQAKTAKIADRAKF